MDESVMQNYLRFEASPEDLRKIFDDLYHIPVKIALAGKNKGHETIQQNYWIWKKGTPRSTIEEFFVHHQKTGEIFTHENDAGAPNLPTFIIERQT